VGWLSEDRRWWLALTAIGGLALALRVGLLLARLHLTGDPAD
jgi:hypothetical protein